MSRYKCIGQYIVFYISYCFIPSITLNDIEQIVNVTHGVISVIIFQLQFQLQLFLIKFESI